MIKLKNYQVAALSTFSAFLEQCKESDDVASTYAELCTDNNWVRDKNRVVYHDRFKGAPSVCIRIPTGGGKTVIAAASIKVVDDVYLQTGGAPLVLWLTPSDVISQQTLKALSTAGHPYRELLEEDFGSVKAIGIEELSNLTKSDFGQGCLIVVANVQTFNITVTDKRKVYSYREGLSAHFAGLAASEEADLEHVTAKDLQVQEEGAYLNQNNVGEVKHSLANLLRLHHPYIVVDEAHNNRTDLFFDTLNRLGPKAILELTATPTLKNNVIYQVSAWELKADDMIKLPVILSEHSQTGWEACLDKTVSKRSELERLTAREEDYIRPIALIQAQKKGNEPSPEQVKNYLIESQHIPEEQIAISTGTQKDLDGQDLFAQTCPIRFVITIQALKEGWDCSFAYVLCGLQNVQSSKDIEQLLGRVLRMPYAKRRKSEPLNCSYANIMSETTQALADTLKDRLVSSMGFDKMEATTFVETQTEEMPEQPTLFDPVPGVVEQTYKLKEKDISILVPLGKSAEQVQQELDTAKLGAVVKVPPINTTRGVLLRISESITKEQEELLRNALEKNEGSKIKLAIHDALESLHEEKSHLAAQRNQITPFPAIPFLFFKDPEEGDVRVLEHDSGLSHMWNPSAYGTRLDGFTPQQVVYISQLDVNRFERMESTNVGEEQLNENGQDSFLSITVNDLIVWLERQVHRPDVSSPVMVAFVGKVVNEYLIGERKFSLSQLLELRVQIANSLKRLLQRNFQQACMETFQQQLNLICPAPDSDSYHFHFDPSRYTPRNCYNPEVGGYDFKKHFYPAIHDLRAKTGSGAFGEEFLCALAIDKCIKVKRWVRNIESSPYSFRLPKSSGYFYPDFVVELIDGRILVVEYKGEALVSTDDTKEKVLMGEIWEKNSNGKGIFLLARVKDDFGRNVASQIENKIQ